MSNKENIEKLFSEALSNYEAPVDPSAWKAVQSGINSGIGAGGADTGLWQSLVAKIPGGIAGLGGAVVGTGIIIGSIFYFTETPDKNPDESIEVTESVNIPETQSTPENIETQIPGKTEKQNFSSHTNQEQKASTTGPSRQKAERVITERSPANQSVSESRKENTNFNSPIHESQQKTPQIINPINPVKKPDTVGQEDAPAPTMKELARIQANPIGGVAPLSVTFNNEASGKTLKWDFGNNEFDKSAGYVKHTFNKAGNHAVILMVTDGAGNTESDTVYIEVLPSSEISPVQNVFTPNEDGLNDVFIIQGKDLAQLKVSIFSANGKLVHKWEGLFGFWDGKLSNGEPAPAGPYFYVIQALGTDSKKYKKNGTINLIR